MLVGELAKAAGVSAQTLRFYERLGFLHPRRSQSGYRQYDDSAIASVRRIKAAQMLGFTLAEIREIVNAAGGLPGSDATRAAAQRKRAAIRRHITELQALDEKLAQFLERCGCGGDRPCAFLA